jgi:hypothetical protein
MATEKPETTLEEEAVTGYNNAGRSTAPDIREDVKGRDFTTVQEDIPDGYFRSAKFLGSMFAIGSAFGCGVAGFTFAAPILSFINNDIGPSMQSHAP